jgi:rare lipoprotein A
MPSAGLTDKGDAGRMLFDDAGPEAGRRTPSWPVGFVRFAGVAMIALTAANCSQQKLGRSIDPKYGVAASPKIVEDGQPVPKGGGRQLVGKPYVVAGRTYVPHDNPNYSGVGLASWYGSNFHGRMTANGEVFDRFSVAAAHTTMPLPSYARVTNLQNGHSIVVRVNDRGPFHANRIIDVSQRTAEALDFARSGTARVRVDYVGPASTSGSDDRILMASLRTDGQLATLPAASSTMVAEARPRTDLPRQAIAFQSYQAPETSDAEEATPAPTAGGRVVGNVPLPPERPFDLGTIPHAGTPVAAAGSLPMVLPPARPIVAGLY